MDKRDIASEQRTVLRRSRELANGGGEAVDGVGVGSERLDPFLSEELRQRLLGRHATGEFEGNLRVAFGTGADDRLCGVLRLPACGKIEAELERGMDERRLLEVALARIVAENDPVHATQERRALDAGACKRLFRRGYAIGCFRHTVPGVGVRGEPCRRSARSASTTRALKRLEHLGHFIRVVADAGHVAKAQIVGLCLVVATVLEKEDAESLAGQVAHLLEFGANDHPDREQSSQQLLLRYLVHRVLGRDVTYFMSENRDELGLRIHVCENTARYENRPPGEGEGVDDRIINYRERPGERWPFTDFCDRLA